MNEWHDFFVAEVGAAAALAGLAIVAISINLARILAVPQLPGRAAEALVIIAGALIASSCALIPQPNVGLGIELVIVGFAVWLTPVQIQLRAWTKRGSAPLHWMLPRTVLGQMATLPTTVGGVLFVLGEPEIAIYCLAGGVVCSLAVGLINTWVLLVEILR